MKLEIVSPAEKKKKGDRRDAVVAFVARPEKKGPALFDTVPEDLREAARASAPPDAGNDGSAWTVPLDADGPAKRLYVLGTGTGEEMAPRKARGFLRAAVRALEKNGETSALVDFPFTLLRMNADEARDFVARNLLVAGYAFPRYKSAGNGPGKLEEMALQAGRGVFAGAPPKELRNAGVEASKVAGMAAFVRDLGNTPSNDMVPRMFADAVKAAAKKRGVKATVLGKKQIEEERMGGLLAVNRGAAEEPRFVILEHRGGRKGEKPVVLVGKGVTFDSGGISIKPSDKMGDMKWDMMGAATVCGAVLAAADLDLPLNVVALAPLTENMPSGSAYKPGDVVTFRNGKTAEIDNTDAEGRVVLADALDYAKEFSPAVIVDYATLTGAAVVALGLEASVLFTDHEDLADALISAGERTDERLWRLPLWDDYKENIRSDWADFKNTGGRYGGSINGAIFLKEFVDPKTPWAHVDIAPTAYFEREHAGYATGATAIGLAMTLRWLKDRVSR
ncbi:MAG: leucyl aminopeptidase [Holophagales bacterium]|nr:leucyl aminopeptidase [Holophagales bacterium]